MVNSKEEDVCDLLIVNGQLGVVVEKSLKNGMVVNFDDELIYVGKHKLKNILLGGIISIHKAQGSLWGRLYNFSSWKISIKNDY